MELPIALVIGFVLGLITKGINVHIEHTEKKPEPPKEAAPSSVHNLPPKMVEYAQKNQGFIDF